jgi:hypothetical protein
VKGLLILAILVTLLASACDPGIGVRIENHSSEPLEVCISDWADPEARGHCDKQEPSETVTWSTICQGDWIKWVVLLSSGSRIYARSATCDDWKRSGAWVRVQDLDNELVTGDSLESRRGEDSGD